MDYSNEATVKALGESLRYDSRPNDKAKRTSSRELSPWWIDVAT